MITDNDNENLYDHKQRAFSMPPGCRRSQASATRNQTASPRPGSPSLFKSGLLNAGSSSAPGMAARLRQGMEGVNSNMALPVDVPTAVVKACAGLAALPSMPRRTLLKPYPRAVPRSGPQSQPPRPPASRPHAALPRRPSRAAPPHLHTAPSTRNISREHPRREPVHYHSGENGGEGGATMHRAGRRLAAVAVVDNVVLFTTTAGPATAATPRTVH